MNWGLIRYALPAGFRLPRSLLLLLAIPGLLGGIWYAGHTEFGKVVGFDRVGLRVEAAARSAYWLYRATRGKHDDAEKSYSYRGYVDRAQKDFLLVYLFDGGGRKRLTLRLANVQSGTVNLEGFAKKVRGENLRFDLYVHPEERFPRAVIWRREEILNLGVIREAGGAEISPKTNVADWVFARYYWRLAISGE
ncbi:hypothetical protein [Geopseudomonas aromaticivorans]